MFALQFLKINIPRVVACCRTAEDTVSVLACLLWLRFSFHSVGEIWYQISDALIFTSHYVPTFLLIYIYSTTNVTFLIAKNEFPFCFIAYLLPRRGFQMTFSLT